MSNQPRLHCTVCDKTYEFEEVDEVEVNKSSSRYECPDCGETKFDFIKPDEVAA